MYWLADIYAVNDLKFHPTFGTFATTGSDGSSCSRSTSADSPTTIAASFGSSSVNERS